MTGLRLLGARRRVAAGVLLVGAGAGCVVATDASKVANLDVRVTADPDTLLPGDSVTLTVTAVNASLDQVRFQVDPCGPLDMDIRTTSGATFLPGVIGCAGGDDNVLMPPGATISATYVWQGEGAGSGAARVAAPPGVYSVRGIVRMVSGRRYGTPTPVWVAAP